MYIYIVYPFPLLQESQEDAEDYWGSSRAKNSKQVNMFDDAVRKSHNVLAHAPGGMPRERPSSFWHQIFPLNDHEANFNQSW